MMTFTDFIKVFDAYTKYCSQQVPQAPQAQPQAPQAQPQAPQAQPQAPQNGSDDVMTMLTSMQAQLNQMQTPKAPQNAPAPLTVDDVIAKIFD